MLYESTRGSNNKKTGAQAVIQGIAEDKGLYVPEAVPALPFDLKEMTENARRMEKKSSSSGHFNRIPDKTVTIH